MTARKQGFTGGLNVDETLELLSKIWIGTYGTTTVVEAIREHWAKHSSGKKTSGLGYDEACATLAGCRQCAIGVSIYVIHRFKKRDQPLMERATKIREARGTLDLLRRQLSELEPYPPPEAHHALEALSHHIRMLGDVLENVPAAVQELTRTKGRPPKRLVEQVVHFLRNGGMPWSEIAELVIDDEGPQGREKRLQGALNRHKTKMSERPTAPS